MTGLKGFVRQAHSSPKFFVADKKLPLGPMLYELHSAAASIIKLFNLMALRQIDINP